MPQAIEFAKMLDHSLVHPTLSEKGLIEGCQLAAKYNLASVCVKPYHVGLANKELANSGVEIGAVIGYPHGNSTLEIKLAEIEQVISDGAREVIMVMNLAKVIDEDWAFLEDEIGTTSDFCHRNGAIVKVIFAIDLIEDKHIIKLSEICSKVNSDFIIASKGDAHIQENSEKHSYWGKNIHKIQLMRVHSSPQVQVMVGGGIDSLDAFIRIIGMGITRVATIQTENIVLEAQENDKA